MKPNKIYEMAKKYVEYDMIQKHTELPAFPDSRIRLLFAFLANQRTPLLHSELYSLVVSLVQLGMDTHDRIDSDSGRVNEREMRSRQLKVLAGDYFSSRFFQLLAQAGQIDMIRLISDRVCEVNRLKINLYMRMKQLKLSADEYLNQSAMVKTEVFHAFTGILDDKFVKPWSEALFSVGRCEAVLEELAKSDKPEMFTGSWGYWHVLCEGTEEEKRKLAEKNSEPTFIQLLVTKYDIRSQLAEKLKHSVTSIQAAAARLDSDKLVRELAQIGETFMRPLMPTAPALGERR
ncbi:heptaprenyl diphosphate synthase component 1 [Paenibacillus spongiae]|uniref:Heptaprenyl diphosphate synthase component 1 n=1 Tax=Paenibacillus spongiae TaxID=2909671 RepID=A0ABY5SEI7_9BACL|nr:heptaprenyl diphosphate synthase component 1 [Paenibacillus spongiae]UVI32387.1 heptaprenyl diphosphate synthase component 1 [Paenibacillus spongiae]